MDWQIRPPAPGDAREVAAVLDEAIRGEIAVQQHDGVALSHLDVRHLATNGLPPLLLVTPLPRVNFCSHAQSSNPFRANFLNSLLVPANQGVMYRGGSIGYLREISDARVFVLPGPLSTLEMGAFIIHCLCQPMRHLCIELVGRIAARDFDSRIFRSAELCVAVFLICTA